jgi:hypothetical protein
MAAIVAVAAPKLTSLRLVNIGLPRIAPNLWTYASVILRRSIAHNRPRFENGAE